MQQDEDDVGIDAADMERIRRIMSELEESDFELLDPPAEIWQGIEASITSKRATAKRNPDENPREAPSRDAPSLMVIEYRIDARDILTDVGQGWADFARDNDAPELAAPATDRILWSYIDRDEIRELWQLLVQRVRTLQMEARVPFRCDAPHARRWLDMTITPEPDDGVHFRSVLVFEESRPPVALLDPHSERDADAQPVPLCGWCGRGQHGSRWLDIEELVQAGRLLERASMPPISHGICAACRDEMSADLLVPGVASEPRA